ncbi:MAG: TVP38/TMEM64 family protein [Clostridia bacterium]|nr:TVP38/TMEM64 family protein [Clostridia bacterium]
MEKREKWQIALWGVGFTAFCVVGFVLFFRLKDKLTLEGLVNVTPAGGVFAVVFVLLLYALKSFLFFIYGGLLYALCGVLFPFSLALLVNLLGSVLMITLPYVVGRRAGGKALAWLSKKYPKTQSLLHFPHKKQTLTCFILRLVGKLPGDLVSVYLGASGIAYGKYLLGSLLGFLPSLLAFTVMGDNVHSPTSPAFIISVAVEVLFIVIAVVWQVRKTKRKKIQEEEQ